MLRFDSELKVQEMQMVKEEQSYILFSEAYPTYPNNNWESGLFPGKVAATVLSLKIEFTEGPKNP